MHLKMTKKKILTNLQNRKFEINNNKSEHKKYYKRKGAEKRGSMSKDKVGLYKNSRVLLYEGRKRNYVRFLLTKKP